MQATKPEKFIRIAFLIFLISSIGSPSAMAADSAEQGNLKLLRKILQTPGNINFRGAEISITIGKNGIPVVEKFTVDQRGTEFKRVKVEDNSQPDEIYIRNKSGTWIYYPKQESLVKKGPGPKPEKGLPEREAKKFQRIQANYDIQFIKKRLMAGRSCSVYAFRPREKERLTREFWVDASSGLPLRIDTFAPNGRLLNVVSFEKIEFNPKFPHGSFTLNVMDQARRGPSKALDVILVPREKLKKNLSREIGFPSYIPKGYGLTNVLVQKRGSGQRYQMIYSDGMVPLSIFQEKVKTGTFKEEMRNLEPVSMPLGGRGYFKQQGLVKILCFSIGDNRKTIVGEIDKNEMLKIADSFYSTNSTKEGVLK